MQARRPVRGHMDLCAAIVAATAAGNAVDWAAMHNGWDMGNASTSQKRKGESDGGVESVQQSPKCVQAAECLVLEWSSNQNQSRNCDLAHRRPSFLPRETDANAAAEGAGSRP